MALEVLREDRFAVAHGVRLVHRFETGAAGIGEGVLGQLAQQRQQNAAQGVPTAAYSSAAACSAPGSPERKPGSPRCSAWRATR